MSQSNLPNWKNKSSYALSQMNIIGKSKSKMILWKVLKNIDSPKGMTKRRKTRIYVNRVSQQIFIYICLYKSANTVIPSE